MVSMKDLEKKASKTVNDFAGATENFITGTTQDLNDLVNTAAGCILDTSKILLQNKLRLLQYNIALSRIIIEASLPNGLISQTFEKARNDLRKKIKPVIYKLNNPHEAVWQDKNKKDVEEVSIPFTFPENRTPYFFVHGAFNKQDKDTAFEFYEKFEKDVKMFEDSTFSSNWIEDIYIISYDTELTDEYEWAIRKAFESILDPIIDPEPNPAPTLFAAVFWQELTIRAQEVAVALMPFFKGLSKTVHNDGLFHEPKIFTHSLGCHVFAHSAQSFTTEGAEMTKIFSEWYCMAAAIPMGSLAPSGQFSDAHKVVMGNGDSYSWRNDKGITVWFSRLDSILSTAYVLASGTLAIGLTGALVMNSNIEDFDVTSKVGLTHTISDGYFTKLGIGAIYHERMTGDPQ